MKFAECSKVCRWVYDFALTERCNDEFLTEGGTWYGLLKGPLFYRVSSLAEEVFKFTAEDLKFLQDTCGVILSDNGTRVMATWYYQDSCLQKDWDEKKGNQKK